MTVLTFPTSPTLGQQYAAPNGIQYVFDGVKWTVETVASTSAAVTNSVQDRIAPMFVAGPNTGIAFAYNAATNVMSAAVTAVNSDTLVNGVHEFTLESNGTLSLDGDPFVITSDRLVNGLNEVVMGANGTLTFPTLTVPISDNATPNGTGQTLKFSDSSQQAIIFGPASTGEFPAAERIIIQGAPGYTGTTGEGGDIYLWAGPGGSVNGDGGDIKVRAGYGPGSGQGGYLNFQAGDTATGAGGYINIESGESGTYGSGGDITVQARSGGEITLRTHTSGGTNNWLFDADGSLTFPDATVQTTAYTGGNANTGNFTFDEDTITNGAGLILNTNRGTLAIGTAMEVPGVAQHFHIAFDGSNSNPPPSDLFFGDDHNYVKLPGSELNPTTPYGVEISAYNNNGGNNYNWRFGTDGVLTLPAGGDIVDSTGTTVLGGGSNSYAPDDTDNWNEPTVNTIQSALDELAARMTAFENFEIDGGNAYTPALGELLIDGNGA